MARHLQILLGTDASTLTQMMREFEQASGHAGVDTKLIGDILERGHRIMRELRLDPADTTAEELYQVLRSHHQTPELFSDSEYVGLIVNGHVVSFNGGDVIVNSNRAFDERSLEHFRAALERELVRRYADHPKTHTPSVHERAKSAGLHIEVTNESPKKIATTDPHAPYVLAVGDIITDAFIKLSEDYAEVHTDKKGYQRLSFELGAKLPYDSVEIVEAVECSPNAAVSMTRLGLQTSLMSWIGDDDPGKSMLKYLEAQGVGTKDMAVEKGMKSNYHYVLRYGADRTKLQKFEDYAYKWNEPARLPDWLYLGVLGEKTWPLHKEMLAYLKKHPSVKLAFQPGMYHLMWGAKKLKDFYKHAEVVILNREEAAQVTGKDRGKVGVLLDAMHELGVKVAVITDGADGAYASDGSKKLFMPNYPDPKKPLDRTGAGDAFASTLTAALALGESLETALTWAPINSMSVVQQMGAQAGLIDQKALKKYLAAAPKNYKVQLYKDK